MDKQDLLQFKLHQQYITRKPVNILVSSKLGCFNPNDLFAANHQQEVDVDLPPPSEEDLKQIEIEKEILCQVLSSQKKQIEQSYLWDRDEADEKKSYQKITINEEGTIMKKDRSSFYPKGSKKPSDDLQKSGLESSNKQTNQKEQHNLLDIKLNDQYFSVVYEANLDFIIKKISLRVSQNKRQGALSTITSGASSMLNFLSRNTLGLISTQASSASENNEEGWCLLQQPGKRLPCFDSDITASAAYGDNLVLGFANGALVVIDTQNESVPNQVLYCNESFVGGGPEKAFGNAILKIKVLFFNELRAKGQDGGLQIISPKESYIVCLARQNLFCLSLPNFEIKDLLEAEQIIDFETYTTPILVGQGGQKVDQDCLVILSQTKVLKLFKFVRAEKCYKYVTKISLSLMTVPSPQQFMNIIKNENQNLSQKVESLPIFDGGIAVYRDHFIIQYRDCAEYIQIQNKGNLFLETITKFKLWDNRKQNKKIINSQKNAGLVETHSRQRAATQIGRQTGLDFDNQIGENEDDNQNDQSEDANFENTYEQQDKENDSKRQFEITRNRAGTMAFTEKQQNIFGKILTKQSKSNSTASSNEGKQLGYPAPIFDEFLKAFIITQDDQSFYLDLYGNYDSKFRPIQWSERVMILRLVSPYLVAYLSDNSVEVRNILNPNRIFNKHELVSQSQFISMAVSNNLLMKNNGRLDDFYVIVKNQPSKSLLDMQKEAGGVGGFLQRANLKSTISQGHQIGDEILSLIKFKQQEPQYQLVFLTKSHLYATFLKLVDYLEDKGLRGGVTAQTYQKNLQKLAFYNFNESRRFYVTRNIVDRLQIQLPLVVSLFSFMYPEGYLNRLFQMFQIDKKELHFFKTNKKISIYQYFMKVNERFKNIAFGRKVQNNDDLQFDDNNLNLTHKQEEKQKEDESLIKELKTKIDQSSQATLIDYTSRMKPGKDPHYQKVLSEPATQLTKNDLESIRIFLPFFLRQKIYLKRQLLFFNTGSYFDSSSEDRQIEKNIQKLSQDRQDPLGTNFSPQQAQAYFQNYTEAQILYLLQVCEMIIFHSLIFLLSSKQLIDKSQEQYNLYKECYETMIKQSFPKFVNDIYDADTAEEIYEKTKQQNQILQIDGFDDEKKENMAFQDIKNQDKPKNSEQQEIFNKQIIPQFFVLDLLFKYGKFEDVCRYLFYRREFKELLFLIKLEYQEAKKAKSEIKREINQMEQNGSDSKILKDKKDQEHQIDKISQKWLKSHIEYIQKINDFQHYVPLEANWGDEQAEDYCDRNSEWVLKEKPEKWIECFKKWSNRNDVIKLREKDLEQKSNSSQIPNVFKKQDEPAQNNLQQQIVCNQPPFMSKKLLQNIGKFKGSIKLGVAYLEYVILKCRVANKALHTELGEIYIQFITSIVKKQYKAVLQDYEKLENEETITKDSILIEDILKKLKDFPQFKEYRDKLRIFLTSSSLYDPSHLEDVISRPDLNLEEQKEDLDDAGKLEIIIKKVFKEVLMKEVAILKMKMMQYKECMDICIGQVKDWQFAQSLARRGYEWHKRDKRIHLQLFQRLLDNGNQSLEELGLKKIENNEEQVPSTQSRKLAVHICSENADQVPYKKVCASFKDDDLVSEDVNMLFARLLQAANKDLALSKMFCGLTTIHKHQLEYEKVNLAQQSIKITGEDTDSLSVSKCSYCQKPIGICQVRFDPKLKQVYHAYHFQEEST